MVVQSWKELTYLVAHPAVPCQDEQLPLILAHPNLLDSLVEQSRLLLKDDIDTVGM